MRNGRSFVGLGIVFGVRWAYEELGWDGYWFWDPDTERASFEVKVLPLVPWIWVGGLVIAVGGLVALWPPSAGPQPRPVRAGAPARAAA